MRAFGLVIAMLVVAGNLAFPHVAGAVEVQARLERDRITAGESTTLEVTVEGSGGFSDPELQLPAGLDLLGSARAQSFSWVNGKSTSQTVFRYELGAGATGTFTIGPARVRAGSDTFSSAPLTLEVLASAPNLGGGGGGAGGGTAGGGIPSGRVGPAALLVDVTPREPWIGQPVTMRVRLVQRQGLAEDPRYGPPSTTGFWAEPASRPASYYAQEGDRRVLVTETRSRLYPLAAGVATIGSAAAELILASGPSFDPLQWPGGGRRRIEVRSDPVPVRVRPLPGGAPPGFDGAVGSFGLAWSADRERTSQDVALTVRFDVRGLGNLPMIHTPVLACDDCEVFVGTVEDSLSTPDSDGASRRSFRWTVLPRRTGAIEIPPPRFAWFDPVAGSYRRVQLPVLAVEVDPALAPGGSGRETFPSVFSEHPVGGEARPARAWAWALGGLLLGSGLALWRVGGRKPADAADRARQREWLRAARLSGPDFWRAAEEATAWLEQRGRPVGDLRGDIAAARYASGYADPEAFRGRLTQALEVAIAPPPSALPLRLLAVVAALAGVALLVAGGPRWGSGRAALDAHAADAKARAGDVDGAQKAWRALWDSGTHAPGLAARLAWAELRAGSTAAATLWAMRGERGEPRDQALRWSWERVRESGGLLGAGATRMPVRSGEWAVAALLLGILAGWLWPGWRRAAVAAVLVLVCAAAGPVEVWRAGRRAEAVVRSALPLDGGAGAAASGAAALELTPGQVVRVLVQDGARVRVIAGRDIVGWVPASAVEVVE